MAISSATRAVFVVVLEASWREETPSAPQVSVPSFATSILWALSRGGSEKGSPPPSHWLFFFFLFFLTSCLIGGCSWCRVGLAPSPIFCFTDYTRLVEGKGGEGAVSRKLVAGRQARVLVLASDVVAIL